MNSNLNYFYAIIYGDTYRPFYGKGEAVKVPGIIKDHCGNFKYI